MSAEQLKLDFAKRRAEDMAKIEALRAQPPAWLEALEMLLLEAEDAALQRGDLALCECVIYPAAGGREIYPSQFIVDVLDNIRARRVRKGAR